MTVQAPAAVAPETGEVYVVARNDALDTVLARIPTTAGRAGGFYLRFRETSGAPAEGLVAMESFDGAVCPASELVDLGANAL